MSLEEKGMFFAGNWEIVLHRDAFFAGKLKILANTLNGNVTGQNKKPGLL
jgi:hypothetical protein